MLVFAAVLFMASWPFWVISRLYGGHPLPGLPLSAAMAICPALAAILLSLWSGGWPKVRGLLAGLVSPAPVSGLWLGLAVALPAASVVLAAMASPTPPPANAVPTAMQTMLLPLLLVLAATAEEIGWSVWLTPRVSRGLGLTGAGLAIGCLWAVWHVLPWAEVGHTDDWILWQALRTVLLRLVIVRLLVRNGRAVVAAILCHAADNMAVFLIPLLGLAYDPMPACLTMGILALLLARSSGQAVPRSGGP